MEEPVVALNGGYIKLYRKSLDSAVFQDANLWKVWCWCLLRANHKPASVAVKTGRGSTIVQLARGQFLFGRNTAAKALKMKPTTIEYRMKTLQKCQNLVIHPGRHYSIVTICKWDAYQDRDENVGSNVDNQLATNWQPTSTDKNEKNVKKEKKVKKPPIVPLEKSLLDLLKDYPALASNKAFASIWPQWIEHRIGLKKPMTELAAKLILKELAPAGPAGAVRAIERSIMNSWKGVFPNDDDKAIATGTGQRGQASGSGRGETDGCQPDPYRFGKPTEVR